MGLENAKWVSCDAECQSPIIIRRFNARGVEKAEISLTGLGYFEAKINGQKITEERYIPVVSDYEKRNTGEFLYPIYDELTNRIYYCTYDITKLIKDGENILEIQLGNGWYRQTERVAEGNTSYSEILKTIYSISLKTACGEEEIASDGSETWKNSNIVYNNLFIGEVWDCTQEDQNEKNVKILTDAKSVLSKQIGKADKVMRIIKPTLINCIENKKIYDAGENVSGVVRVNSSAPRGEKITLKFAENITANKTLNFDSTGSRYIGTSGRNQIMTDIFVADGNNHSFEPKFVWHSFRYFEVEGDTDSVEVLVIHSDVEVTAAFNSSSSGLNFLFDAFIRTQLNNMHGSIPSDCPHRERLGYTGDGQVCAKAAMLTMDSTEFYRKWIWDILDCQDKKSGHIQHTAPFMGGGGGPGGWGAAVVVVPYVYYRQTGDLSVLKKCYSAMKLWTDYMCNHMEDGLIVREEENGWCLGDWCTLEPTQIPEPFVNSCYFIKCLSLMTEIAVWLDCKEDIAAYHKLIQKTSDSVKKVYFDKTKNCFCDGIQGADAYAVWCNISDGKAVKKIAEIYDKQGFFDTGFLGTDILLEVLFKNGCADTALSLLESEEVGSFLYMKNNGATTLWEKWNGKDSHNHPMFGACCRQLFESILGIKQASDSCGYERVIITPKIPQKLNFAEGSIVTKSGKIYVGWKRKQEYIEFDISVPSGVDAIFSFNDYVEEINGGRKHILCKTGSELYAGLC